MEKTITITKYFCDCCGKECSNKNKMILVKLPRDQARVDVSLAYHDREIRDGLVCDKCALTLLRKAIAIIEGRKNENVSTS